MAVTTLTCWVIRCDVCGVKLDFDGEPHWSSVDEARSIATGELEWYSNGTTDLCLDCRTLPHAPVLDPGNADDCLRCGNSADEHTGTTTEEG